MKITQYTNEKPKYVPITITLETAEEYCSLLAALKSSSTEREIYGLYSLGIGCADNTYVCHAEALYEHLLNILPEVKETL